MREFKLNKSFREMQEFNLNSKPQGICHQAFIEKKYQESPKIFWVIPLNKLLKLL